jgi:hypothetical protein
MNTYQITHALEHDPVTSKQFCGVFPSDKLPQRKSFGNFLKTRTWDFNKRKLQSAWSDVCGQYCIFYLSHRARGFSLSRIVHLFNSDTISNDAKVSTFVKRHFKVVPKRSSVNNQFSKKMLLIKNF